MAEILSKTCELCGSVFYRTNKRLSKKEFMEQRYCCKSCAMKARAMERKKKDPNQMPSWAHPKTCEHCGKEFWPHKTEARNTFERRRFCGLDCMYAWRVEQSGRTPETKTCPVCGKTFERKPGGKKSNFRVQVYCSRKCSGIAQRGMVRTEAQLKGREASNAGGPKREKIYPFNIYVNRLDE